MVDELSEMIVYENLVYKKEKINGKKIVNNIFEIFDCIGEGSFWKVFKVHRNLDVEENKDNNYYVFKEGKLSECSNYFNNENLENEDCENRRGIKEYSILKNINHKNIARLYECIMDIDLDKIVMVMEFADLGELMIVNNFDECYEYNLELINFIIKECLIDFNCIDDQNLHLSIYPKDYQFNFLKDHKLLIQIAKFIFRQLAEAINYLHFKGITHRDIKPNNISMKSHDKNIKLLDFSISKKLNCINDLILCNIGTPAFDPPEINNSEFYNPFQADIYSYGATLYVFLFNRLDYNLSTDHEDIILLLNEYPSVYEIIKSMLNDNPNYRPNIKEILVKINDI